MKTINYRGFIKHQLGSSGFTLVELLVVMAIIAILTAIGLVSFRTSQMRSRDVQRKSDLRQLANSLELFYSDYETYPASNNGGIVACPYDPTVESLGCSWGTSEFRDETGIGNVKTIYFRILPKDPSGGSYYYVSTGQEFKIYAHLENTQDTSLITTSYMCGTNSPCNFAITSTNTTP